MSERTTGLYRAVTVPAIYSAIQRALGGHSSRQTLVRDYIQPVPGCRVLDLGCGPGSMVPYVGDVDYFGLDLNPRHITRAQAQFPHARFSVGTAADLAALSDRRFDRIIAIGLLHHLDDADATALLRQAAELLAPRGRMVTVDPLLTGDGHPIARFLISRDSGRNVRTGSAYEALAATAFDEIDSTHRTNLARVPYDHWIMCLSRPRASGAEAGAGARQ